MIDTQEPGSGLERLKLGRKLPEVCSILWQVVRANDSVGMGVNVADTDRDMVAMGELGNPA